MKHFDEKIKAGNARREIVDFINTHGDIKEDRRVYELKYVIAYCVGYFGAVDAIVWDVIRELIREGVIV